MSKGGSGGGNNSKYLHKVRLIQELPESEQLAELENLLKDLSKSRANDLTTKCGIAREVLKDITFKKRGGTLNLEVLANLLTSAYECLPHVTDTGCTVAPLSELVSCITNLCFQCQQRRFFLLF